MIVFDTHVWAWWVESDPKLRDNARNAIQLETDIRISAISIFEIALANSRNRLRLNAFTR